MNGVKHLAVLIIVCLFSQVTKAQDFPDALSLIQFIQGINKSKLPKYVRTSFNVIYYTDNYGPGKGIQYFDAGNAQYILFTEGVGFNAKIHDGENQIIFLKSEKVYESKKLDIENFLMFDIHKRAPEESVEILKNLGIDTDIVDDGIRLGRPIWIIGTQNQEMDVPQLWIDKERFVITKIQYINLPQQSVEQMEWDDFIPIDDFYIGRNVELRADPEIMYRISRSDFKVIEKLPEELKDILKD